MIRVEEIERGIEELNGDEFAPIALRVHTLERERWDVQMDQDASAGQLDFLIAEVRDDRANGRLRDWPEGK